MTAPTSYHYALVSLATGEKSSQSSFFSRNEWISGLQTWFVGFGELIMSGFKKDLITDALSSFDKLSGELNATITDPHQRDELMQLMEERHTIQFDPNMIQQSQIKNFDKCKSDYLEARLIYAEKMSSFYSKFSDNNQIELNSIDSSMSKEDCITKIGSFSLKTNWLVSIDLNQYSKQTLLLYLTTTDPNSPPTTQKEMLASLNRIEKSVRANLPEMPMAPTIDNNDMVVEMDNIQQDANDILEGISTLASAINNDGHQSPDLITSKTPDSDLKLS